MYSVLIKDKKFPGNFSYLQVKKEIMNETVEKVEDESNNMVDKIIYTPTGEFENVVFQAKTKEELEAKAKELLQTYNLSELRFIDDLQYGVDFSWETSH